MVPSRLVAALAATSFALTAFATTAAAAPDKPLVSGDSRAIAFSGNVAIEHDDACTVGNLTGEPIAGGKFEFTGGDNQAELDITAVPDGVTVTGVVVKGGPRYNVYLAAALGEVPWNDLHAPLNDSGKPAAISHWYACGVKSSEEPPAEDEPREETPREEQPKNEQPTSTSAAAAPGGAEAELAATGFGSPWLVGIGAALVAAGAGVLFLLRRRKA